ncbi:MAG: nitrilase-related carbon-nitrogen hydrolase, partial [Elusimicrobiota bacterium]|nr:nitrilase-related carbon-nitrogen hydrolase [Elusimicrobiota bacterium]
LSAISGILLILSYPPFSFWFLAWISFLPLFYAVSHAKDIRQVANLSGLCGLVFYCVSLRWFFNIFGPFAIGLICVITLFLVFAIIGTKKAVERFGTFWGWLLFGPVLWVGFEYFRSEVWFLKFTWFGLGYSQVNSPILQTASVWGTYGISFFIIFSQGLMMNGLNEKRLKYFVTGLLIPILFLVYGNFRISCLNHTAATGRKIKVGVIQDESYNLKNLLKFERKAIENGAEIIVWPEYAVQFRKDFKELILFKMKTEKKDIVRVIGGMIIHSDEALKGSSILSTGGEKRQVEDFVLVLNEKIEIFGRYDKHHPIPIIEKNLKPSKKVFPVDTPKGKIGIQICYDLDFEDGTRKLTNQGAEVILVPNLDPVSYGKLQHLQHSVMSPMRAVESGLWIARAASSGISQLIDPSGRIVNSLDLFKEDTLTGYVYLKKGGTVYTKIGWLLHKVCLFISLLFGMIIFIRVLQFFLKFCKSSA